MSDALPAGLLEDVRDRLAVRGDACTPQHVATALRATGRPVGDATVLAVHEALRREVVGAGVPDPLLREPGVTDVLVKGPDEVWFDRGRGLERSGVRFRDEEAEGVLGAPVLATMADQRGLDEAVDLGLGPLRSRRSILGRTAAQVLATLTDGGRLRSAGGTAA